MTENKLLKTLNSKDIAIAGIAVVVAASSMVTDFTGFVELGLGFALSLLIGFLIHLALGYSLSNLASKYPKAGTLFNYSKEIIKGKKGTYIGLFLGLTFYMGVSFGISAEANAGAFALKKLVGLEIPDMCYVLFLFLLGATPNIFNVRTSAKVAGAILIVMLAIRWYFGLKGFFSGQWDVHNLADTPILMGGDNGILTKGLALGIWTFVGIEFCASFAEEVKNPKTMIFKGILMALLVILSTSLIMGMGVIGTLPKTDWLAIVQSDLGCAGDCPQLAVGYQMMGNTGLWVMALGSVLATISSLIVVFSAMPRLLFGIIRDGNFHGKLPIFIKRINPRSHTPINAILISLALYVIPSMYSQHVGEWVIASAYIGLMMYGCYHFYLGLSLYRLKGKILPLILGIIGVLLSGLTIFIVFYGAHSNYGLKTLWVLGASLLITLVLSHKRSSGKIRVKLHKS